MSDLVICHRVRVHIEEVFGKVQSFLTLFKELYTLLFMLIELESCRVGTYYEHYKGGLYRAIAIAKDCECPKQFLVVYQCVDTGTVWSKKYEDWCSHPHENPKKERFKRVEVEQG